MKQQNTGETLCPLARAAAVLADRWTLLILRELTMGNDRFDGIQAQTGMSPNLLTQRLKTMEDNGLIERLLYQERPKRHAYLVTDKTRELDEVVLSLRLWGMRHCGLDQKAESAVTMTHRRTGAIIGADWHPEEADLPFTFSQVETRINPAWAAERAARAEAFAAERRIQVSKRAPQKKRAAVTLKAESVKRDAASVKD
ncbi:winged helix-turn-helix transcriptional regulator [Paraburkholderia elongata]|uniref:Transcriptional regulator n=1 Tax=Paraburkholderia elongata TaxID=2675747 RepID=A0A972SNC2_9BURK|nr:helix-turn-helix domain-containing protein [Paraburkholderia elongata]NPT61154.1 transcriptional regulator [Paraburkholderia elongata]